MDHNRCYGCMEILQEYPCPRCGYSPEENKRTYALESGSVLKGRYLMGKVLGQGGFGITYIGWDTKENRKVAVKEFFPSGHVSRSSGSSMLIWYTTEVSQSARKDGGEMFLKEARKMDRVRDVPQVIRILDLFQENNTAYIVMEFVEGQTLKEWIKKHGPMEWEKVKQIFLPVMESMRQVHAAGLIHRDISPDNLMLKSDGTVKILDLGAAKDLNLNSGASSAQVAKGGFSPIEQYAQRGGSGTWTDVYAMAATVYYTLTGVVPPTAIDRMDQDTLNWELPQLQALPDAAIQALKKAMAIRPKERTQTMAQFSRQLKRKTSPKGGGLWKIAGISAIAAVCVLAVILVFQAIQPGISYNRAVELMEQGKYPEALELFEDLGDYQDSRERAEELTLITTYDEAEALMKEGKYQEALALYSELGDYKDSREKAARLPQMAAYAQAEAFLTEGKPAEAAMLFGTLEDYRDAGQRSVALWDQLLQRSTFAAGGGHIVGIQKDGSVVTAGKNDVGQCDLTGWTDVISVSTGSIYTAGLKADGTVLTAGDNQPETLDGEQWKNIVSVSIGSAVVGLKTDGTVVAAGSNQYGQCDVSGWTDILAVSAGEWYTLGLKTDGTVVSAGYNENGQCNVDTWTDITAISAASWHCAGLKADGTAVATGYGKDGQCDVSGWTDLVAVSAGYDHTVGLRSDGTVVATGWNAYGQCDVNRWTDIVAIKAGTYFTVGMKSDGTIVIAGDDFYGQSAAADWTDIRMPK